MLNFSHMKGKEKIIIVFLGDRMTINQLFFTIDKCRNQNRLAFLEMMMVAVILMLKTQSFL